MLFFILKTKKKDIQAEQKFNFAQLCLNVVRSSEIKTVLALELIYEKVD